MIPPATPPPHANIRERLLSWCPLVWVRRIRRDGEPYLNRYSIREQGPSGHNPWRIYLHHFLAPDGPHLHNHPSAWSFSIVLWGSYTETGLMAAVHAPGEPLEIDQVAIEAWKDGCGE